MVAYFMEVRTITLCGAGCMLKLYYSIIHWQHTSRYARMLYVRLTFLNRAGKELARYNATDWYSSSFAMSKQFQPWTSSSPIPSPARGASSFTKSKFPVKSPCGVHSSETAWTQMHQPNLYSQFGILSVHLREPNWHGMQCNSHHNIIHCGRIKEIWVLHIAL